VAEKEERVGPVKKDSVYCLRMNTAVREALQRVAQTERRSLSSLLDKIISGYLEEGEVLPQTGFAWDQRRFPRVRVNLPARAKVASGSNPREYACVVLDLSLGGALLTYPRGSNLQVIANGKLPSFELSFQLPQAEEELHFHCRARHISESGGGLQVGAVFDEPAEKDLTKLQAYLN
jgi:hypothetical protein